MLAKAGVSNPPLETPGLDVQVPPPGAAVKLMAVLVLQSGAGIVSDGVSGLLIVTVMVLVTGQLITDGDTVTL